MSASRKRYLEIYLADHLAGSVAGYELARRTLKNNRDTRLGDFLANLVQELREDKERLEELMRRLGAPRPRYKQWAAWGAEKAGRLKLNGQIAGYSELSRVLELEGLSLGVEGKLRLWRALRSIAQSDARLETGELDDLIERAQSQLERLETHRSSAAEKAFGA